MKPTIYIPSELTSLLIPRFLVCRDREPVVLVAAKIAATHRAVA